MTPITITFTQAQAAGGGGVTGWWAGLPPDLKLAAVAVTVLGVGWVGVWLEAWYRSGGPR